MTSRTNKDHIRDSTAGAVSHISSVLRGVTLTLTLNHCFRVMRNNLHRCLLDNTPLWCLTNAGWCISNLLYRLNGGVTAVSIDW